MQISDSHRSKTFTWEDPAAVRAGALQMSGLERMRAMRDGKVSAAPIAVLMGFSVSEAEPGRVVFIGVPGEEHYNPIGVVHGGFACTILDSVAACAGQTTLERGFESSSIEIKVNYLRPITVATGPVRATGTVTKPGRRVIFTEGILEDERGTLLATAQSSLLVLGIPPAE